MPRLVLKCDSSGRQNFPTFCALGGELVLKTLDAVDFLLVRDDERLGSDLCLTLATLETAIVPLAALVLYLLHTRLKLVSTRLAFSRELSIVTRTAENLLKIKSA